MKYSKFLGVLLVLAIALTACSSAATPTQPSAMTLPPLPTEESTLTTGTGEAGTPSADTTSSPFVDTTGTPSVGTGTGTAGVPVTGADCSTVTVQVANGTGNTGGSSGGSTTTGTSTPGTVVSTPSTTTGGTTTTTGTDNGFLVDCNGMALYVTMDDTPNSGTSTCTDTSCTDEWTPLTVGSGETPMAGDGVDDSLLSTITRDDGTTQVTYNGWPLYLYSEDQLPGDQMGVGMNDTWYLISPSGDPIQQQ